MATTFTAPATMYDTPAAANAGYQALIAKQQADQAAKHRSAVTKTLLGGAALFGGALAAPALAGSFGAMSGGSAAVAAPTWGTVAGTTSGGLAGGSMGAPWWKLGELAVGTFGNIYGANKSQSANRESLRAQMAGQTQAEILAREQMAEEKRQFELTRQEQAAQWAADQKFQADKFAASEEERLYDRRLKDEREARMGPYREASAAALQRLPGLIASGRQTPGMGSLKWMAGK